MMLTKSVAMSGRTVARPAMSGRTAAIACPTLRSRSVVVRAADDDKKAPFTPKLPEIPNMPEMPSTSIKEPDNPVTEVKEAVTAARTQKADEPSGFVDVMAFSGIGPELINGRLAMLGFTAAMGAEWATSTPVVQQVTTAPYLIAATFAAIIGASLLPLLQGNKNRTPVGPWTPSAEVWNGRTAMVGFASLLAYEAYFGHALL